MNLRLRERSTIDRPVELVWQFVADPRQFAQWNKKVLPTGLPEFFKQGETYRTQSQWRRKSIASNTLVEQLVPLQVLKLHHSKFSGDGIRPDMDVIEEIQLAAKGTRTVVTKFVTMKNHGIPFIFVLIGWLVGNFGKRVDPDYLKELCERPELHSLPS